MSKSFNRKSIIICLLALPLFLIPVSTGCDRLEEFFDAVGLDGLLNDDDDDGFDLDDIDDKIEDEFDDLFDD